MRMLEEILSDAVPHHLRKERLEDAEIFCIDNVAEYLYAQTDQEEWDIKNDFPCLAPPYPTFWMEYTRPSKVVSSMFGVRGNEGLPYRVGLLFMYRTFDEAWKELRDASGDMLPNLEQRIVKFKPELEELRRMREAGQNFSNPLDPRIKELPLRLRMALAAAHEYRGVTATMSVDGRQKLKEAMAARRSTWAAACLSFMQIHRHGEIFGPLGQHTFEISDQGAVTECSFGYNVTQIRSDASSDNGASVSTLLFPALLAISFCHCKNVNIRRTDEADKKLQKRREERGKRSLSFRVLEIEPMKKTLEKAAEENHTGLKKALHICRGHFAEYLDRGLFGKYKGRFWIPQHVRGSIEKGIAVKDYEVQPPGSRKEA